MEEGMSTNYYIDVYLPDDKHDTLELIDVFDLPEWNWQILERFQSELKAIPGCNYLDESPTGIITPEVVDALVKMFDRWYCGEANHKCASGWQIYKFLKHHTGKRFRTRCD